MGLPERTDGMIKEKIGMVLFALGIMSADSEWLIVPTALVIAGMWLMKGLVTHDTN